MSKTRFQETMLDFAQESIKEENYRGVDIRVTDPYGYWIGDGISGYFTSRDRLEVAIDTHLDKQALERTEKAVQAGAEAASKVAKGPKTKPSTAV